MGHLTTITFSNDAYSDFAKNKEQLADGILAAMRGSVKRSFPVGSYANPVILQKPVHSRESRIYVQGGNTVCLMDAYSNETEELMTKHPEFFKQLLSSMEYQVKELKKKLKETNKK